MTPNYEMLRSRAIQALQNTWDAIAPDVLEDMGRDTADRDLVIEMVTNCGFEGGHPDRFGDDPEAVAWLESLDFDAQMEVTEEAFPDEWYG